MIKKQTKPVPSSGLVPAGNRSAPPVLIGRDTPEVRRSLENFFDAIADIFERWVTRRESPHTQRAYRQDVMSLVKSLGVAWPAEARQLVTVSVADVQAWRDEMLAAAKAPKTVNRRVSSVSSFYRFLQAVAAEMQLPISVPNPAHAQFIARSSTDPINETHAMTATRARQLMGLPRGDDVVALRDRAILRSTSIPGPGSTPAAASRCPTSRTTTRTPPSASASRATGGGRSASTSPRPRPSANTSRKPNSPPVPSSALGPAPTAGASPSGPSPLPPCTCCWKNISSACRGR